MHARFYKNCQAAFDPARGSDESKGSILTPSGLNANSKCYWPHRTSNTWDRLVRQYFYWCYKIFFNIARRNIAWNSLTTFIFIYFIFIYFKNIWGHSWRETCSQLSPNVYRPCKTSWYIILLARSCLWEFVLTWGQRFYCKRQALPLMLSLYAAGG